MLKYISLIAVAMTAGCTAAQPEEPQADSLTLTLNISDTQAQSRAAEPTEAINTLRVIIAKTDGAVEVNRLLRLNSNALAADDLRFRISHDPYKTVVLIANEAATGQGYDAVTNINAAALDNPVDHADALLGTKVDRLPTAATSVPMTAIYQLGTSLDLAQKIGANSYEVKYTLCLLRAVTKFTFNIYNYRNTPIDIEMLGIDLIEAEQYHLFPRVKSAAGAETMHYFKAQGKTLTESGTNAAPTDCGAASTTPFSDYYRSNFIASDKGKSIYYFSQDKFTLAPSTDVVTKEYYYYESNLPDGREADNPYSLYVKFDGTLYNTPLDDLSALPRNMHVVVNMKFNENVQIEVLPYKGVTLNPGFGKSM